MSLSVSLYWIELALLCSLISLASAFSQHRMKFPVNVNAVTISDAITTPVPSVLEVFFNELVKMKSKTQFHHIHSNKLTGHVTNMADLAPEDSDDGHGDLFSTILRNIRNGQVTSADVMKWLAAIKTGVANGSITSGKMNSFLKALPNVALRNAFKDKCCPFG